MIRFFAEKINMDYLVFQAKACVLVLEIFSVSPICQAVDYFKGVRHAF